MSDVKTRLRPTIAYEDDFYAWSKDQAARLRDLRPNSIDWKNLAEEIEDLGSSSKHEIESRLLILLIHLVKWAFQPSGRKSGWAATVREQRRRIRKRIEASPSLASYPAEALAEEYGDARLAAVDDTELPLDTFPETCPFTIEQVLDPDFWPDMPAL